MAIRPNFRRLWLLDLIPCNPAIRYRKYVHLKKRRQYRHHRLIGVSPKGQKNNLNSNISKMDPIYKNYFVCEKPSVKQRPDWHGVKTKSCKRTKTNRKLELKI